jgi:Ca-activated chloride channel family protein
VCDLLPAPLTDLFEGDRLVVLGRYTGRGGIGFELSGTYRGTRRRFRFSFDLDRASTRNAFVARLWAGRKIGALVDEIRQSGASPAAAARVASRRSSVSSVNSALSSRFAAGASPVAAAAPADPRWKELVDEVVRLSTRYGVLTEYTAFLAREGTDLSARNKILAEADRNFRHRGVACRTGMGAVNQSLNGQAQQKQSCLNNRNFYLDRNLNRVEVTGVQQVADRAFFRRGDRWVDSRLLGREAPTPDRVVVVGTAAFRALVDKLTAAHRQACLGLRGEILIEVGGEAVLVRAKAERSL